MPTYLFDEVDAGVGGKAAVEIGRRLAKLARTAQVVVVTHLPQVAAFATGSCWSRRRTTGPSPGPSVTVLEGEDRVRELSRMLAGQENPRRRGPTRRNPLATARAGGLERRPAPQAS